MIRISSDYNGTCFKIGDTSLFTDSDDEEDNYRFVLEWTCANFANCDALGIEFLDGMYIISHQTIFLPVFFTVFFFLFCVYYCICLQLRFKSANKECDFYLFFYLFCKQKQIMV